MDDSKARKEAGRAVAASLARAVEANGVLVQELWRCALGSFDAEADDGPAGALWEQAGWHAHEASERAADAARLWLRWDEASSFERSGIWGLHASSVEHLRGVASVVARLASKHGFGPEAEDVAEVVRFADALFASQADGPSRLEGERLQAAQDATVAEVLEAARRGGPLFEWGEWEAVDQAHEEAGAAL